MLTECNEVFLGDLLCESGVNNILTWLIAWEDFTVNTDWRAHYDTYTQEFVLQFT
jgi:hypothetical protein